MQQTQASAQQDLEAAQLDHASPQSRQATIEQEQATIERGGTTEANLDDIDSDEMSRSKVSSSCSEIDFIAFVSSQPAYTICRAGQTRRKGVKRRSGAKRLNRVAAVWTIWNRAAVWTIR